MSLEGQKFYPGQEATPKQVLELAEEYRKAAETLLPFGRRRKPLSRAPFRLAAIQAIELYLNAILLARGHAADSVRGMQHNLAVRVKHVDAAGIKLKLKTVEHLKALSERREYLVSRYGPEMTGTASQLNRLAATLDQVSRKAVEVVSRT